MPDNENRLARCSIPIPLGPDGKAPDAFPIWEVGDPGVQNVEAEYPSGSDKPDIKRHIVDQEAVDLILGNWKRRGIDLMGDYEHQSLNENLVGPIPASIESFKLDVRPGPGGKQWLWATDLVWQEDARELVETGKYRYFSPAFDWDRATTRIRWLINIALTNNPATNNMPALVAAAGVRWIDKTARIDTANYPARRSTPSKPRETSMTVEIQKLGLSKLGDAIAEHMKYHDIDHDKMARHLGLSSDSLKTMMTGGPDKLTPEHHKSLTKLAEHMQVPVHHLRSLAMDETGDEEAEEARKASLAAAAAKKKTDEDTQRQLAKLQAEASAKDVALAAMKAQVDGLVKKGADAEMASLLAASEKKLYTPDLLAKAKAHGEKYGMASLVELINLLPEGGPASFKSPEGEGLGGPASDDKDLAGLTEADARVARLLGNDAKELAKFKAGDFTQRRPDPAQPGKLAFPGVSSPAKWDLSHLGQAAAVNNRVGTEK